MGNASSGLIDCIQDGDIPGLRDALCERKRQKQQQPQSELHAQQQQEEEVDNNDPDLEEIEDAVHVVVSTAIGSSQQLQQLQIALELLLQAEPRAHRTTTCNECQWTAVHRASVTGNLSFVPFLFDHHRRNLDLRRDLYGLTPMDLVPPELIDREPSAEATRRRLSSTCTTTEDADGAFPAATSRRPLRTTLERRRAAIGLLREAKWALEAETVHRYLACHDDRPHHRHSSLVTPSPSSPTVTAMTEPPLPEFYVRIEPNREGLPSTSPSGRVHVCDRPLRVRFRLPRADGVLRGYFQLIWRGLDDPRSEEPQYDQHVTMREEMYLDDLVGASNQDDEEHDDGDVGVEEDDENDNDDGHGRQHDDEKQRQQLDSSLRRLVDDAPVLAGGFPISISHIPEDAVCHVLFIASDRYMMHREILASTEGVRIIPTAAVGEVSPSQVSLSGTPVDEGFVFHVAGESFTHASEELAGQVFETVEEFQAFVRTLRAGPSAPKRDESPSSPSPTAPEVEDDSQHDHRGDKVAQSRIAEPSSNQEDE